MAKTSLYLQALAEMKKKSPDHEKVFRLLEKSSDKGDADSKYALALCYHYGTLGQRNSKEAVKLLKSALSRKNIPEAMFNLGVSYERGEGIRRSEKKAYECYLTAAVWGDKEAFYEVGRCLYYGIGVQKNRGLADVWLDQARILGVRD